MPKSGVSLDQVPLEVQDKLYKAREQFWLKNLARPNTRAQKPDHLFAFQEPDSASRASQLKGYLRSGEYRLEVEDRHITKLKQAVQLREQEKVDRLIGKMGIRSIVRDKEQKAAE